MRKETRREYKIAHMSSWACQRTRLRRSLWVLWKHRRLVGSTFRRGHRDHLEIYGNHEQEEEQLLREQEQQEQGSPGGVKPLLLVKLKHVKREEKDGTIQEGKRVSGGHRHV